MYARARFQLQRVVLARSYFLEKKTTSRAVRSPIKVQIIIPRLSGCWNYWAMKQTFEDSSAIQGSAIPKREIGLCGYP